MKTLTPVLIAITLAAGLGGCSTGRTIDETPGTLANADGKACSAQMDPTNNDPVYIDIRLDGQGMPYAEQRDCKVYSGTRVTWRSRVRFDIRFKGIAPLADRGRAPLSSAEAYGVYKIRVDVIGPVGTYPYGIEANGHVVDPAIIIRPN